MTATLIEERAEGALRLTLNRPEARNALSIGLMTTLLDALGRAAKDPAIRVIVIAGAGPAFCAGHDLRELRADPKRETYEHVFSLCSELMMTIVRLPKPVIAEVHGVATAAGCQLVATCDLAIAAEEARSPAGPIHVVHGQRYIADGEGWLVREAATEALDEVNAQRAARGLPPFMRDESLTAAALAAARFRADRLIAGWTAACRARERGRVHARSHIERLMAGLPPHCGLVSVLDGHPATLAWLGAVYGHKVRPLGVEHFGQTGSIPDLYRHYGIDANAIIAAAQAIAPGGPIRYLGVA